MIAALALLMLCCSLAGAADLKRGDTTLAVRRDGCGLIDAVVFKGRPIVRAAKGFAGASITLAPAGSGSIDSLFPHRAATTLRATVAELAVQENTLTISGAYSDGKTTLPFTRTLRLSADGRTLTVREETDFSRLPGGLLVVEHALALPLVVCKDEHDRMLAFGGARRAELWRMDMNDERRRNQLISCSRAFRPYWDIGGVLQLHGAYRIWRANHANTMAYPIEDGRGAPGWADYSEPDWGITAAVVEPSAFTPWAIQIDARKGILTIAPHPASQMPVAGPDRGKRFFAFTLTFHETSWPAALPCELSLARYRELLAYLNQGGRFTHLDYACNRIGVMAPGGPKTPAQLDDVFRRLVLKERVQPSVVLRLYYRGDAWRMSGLVQAVLGKRVPRDAPLATWEPVAKAFLDKVRAGGLPRAPGR